MSLPLDRTETATKFAVMTGCRRIWAVSSIHADVGRLESIHDAIAGRLKPRDGLVYLGNIIGVGQFPRETVTEILAFRRRFIARHHAFASDVAYLRGSQEEMWQRLLELQFAAEPQSVLNWMLDHGLGATLAAYGIEAEHGLAACREGALAVTRWTSRIRGAINAAPGHANLLTALRRAAYTADGGLLFVHAGIDPERSLTEQGDAFWWGGTGFLDIVAPYDGYQKVVRGFDRHHAGFQAGPYAISLDRGCGFGGTLACACFAPTGEILDSFEA